MKTTIQLLSILLLVMLIQSCSKSDPCPKGQENYYNLTDEEKSKIPYTGTDTLVFISDKGDTATLIGKGKSQSYTRSTSGGNPDCGASSYTYENYEKIDLNYLGANTEFQNLLYQIYIANNSSALVVKCNNLESISYDLWGANKIEFYNDSVYINNILYKGVYLKSKIDSNIKYLFNYKFGVLCFVDSNKKKWTKLF